MRNVNEIIGSDIESLRSMGDNWRSVLRVASPGIIQSFDKEEQTVKVQLALRELINKEDLSQQWLDIPILLDVPIVIPRAGNYAITFPIKKDDECLVIFSDMCIDAWFSNGGIQNQIELRRHDLSDAFAILGPWSQPNKIENYSDEFLQIRNEKGNALIEMKENEINLVADLININGVNFNKHIHNMGSSQTSMPY